MLRTNYSRVTFTRKNPAAPNPPSSRERFSVLRTNYQLRRISDLKNFPGLQLVQRPFIAHCGMAFVHDALFFAGFEM
ncbi:MAG: hypothetical protein QG652_904 [Pseudomonadota bacterium]|nr:hypothetical protein [Pseudomonadota bacterium]